MEPDARFVEDVENSHQLRSDLRCQPDPLPLAPRKRASGPVESEVLQADIQQKFQPLRNFLQDLPADLHLPGIQRKVVEKSPGRANRKGNNIVHVRQLP